MNPSPVNLLVVLGPTASGKTRLGVGLARAFGGEIVSADSRQVYRGLDLGAGKDLDEYEEGGGRVPYHLIDIVDLDHEFSVFEYQRRFYEVFEALTARRVLPILVGGTGLYIEAVLEGYRMVEAPEDPQLRIELSGCSGAELVERLESLRGGLHNTTDLTDRGRLIRAIEIAAYAAQHEAPPAPPISPLILGVRWPRDVLRGRIRERLVQRLDAGMIEEVQGLHENGVSWDTLDLLGLEYRHVAEFFQGRIRNRNDLVQKLASAIYQFARRQESWFRRMERNGRRIHWLDQADFDAALKICQAAHLQ